MKRTIFIILLATIATASAQTQYTDIDTLGYIPRRYYTPEWYADCPAFQSDTNDFAIVLDFLYAVEGTVGSNLKQYVNEYHVDGQIEIKGLMCLVDVTLPQSRYTVETTERAPEWLTLLQGGAMHPGTGLAFPREMTVVDSLRWDTAHPYIVRLPHFSGATADSDFFLFYAYDVYFPAPIVLDSSFYVAGSVYGNIYEMVVEDDGQARFLMRNYPTVYGCIGADIRNHPAGLCDFCTTRENRMFSADIGLGQDREDWYEVWHVNNHQNDRFRQITGPMFAIVDLHTLTLNSSDPDAGSVSGGGEFPHLSTATVTAHPAPGHSFLQWNDGNRDNPRTVQMLSDTRLVAIFR